MTGLNKLRRIAQTIGKPRVFFPLLFERLVWEPWNSWREQKRLVARRRFLSGNPRPTSGDYLSGDTFRSLCEHGYGDPEDKPWDPRGVRPGDRIFCKSYDVRSFLQGPARELRVPFVLLSGNGDANIDDSYLSDLPAALVTWYAQNLLTRGNPRVRPLPIGLENQHYYNNGIVSEFERLGRRLPSKKTRILIGFNVGTNEAVRRPAWEVGSRHPLAFRPPRRVLSGDYRRLLARSKFVLSPPGNGEDCHRTWEALYLKTVPIVRRSALTEEFASRGLPLLQVDSWEEILAMDVSWLERCYQRMLPRFSSAALSVEVWKREFDALREACRV